jgi:hypothetical protein
MESMFPPCYVVQIYGSACLQHNENFTIVAFNSSTAKCVWASAFSLPPEECFITKIAGQHI